MKSPSVMYKMIPPNNPMTTFELKLMVFIGDELDKYIGFNDTKDYRLAKHMNDSLKRFYNKEAKRDKTTS